MDAQQQLHEDAAMLDRVEAGGAPEFRLWHADEHCVVLGRSLVAEREVDLTACEAEGVAVLRRGSGGGAVLIGPGTLQYAFALPCALAPELSDIPSAKEFCNRLLVEGIASAGDLNRQPLVWERGGDLLIGERKVAGIALRRRRHALLVHGTILIDADLKKIARLLRHPSREPSYRSGRSHLEFLTNLGTIPEDAVTGFVTAQLASYYEPSTPPETTTKPETSA